MADLDRIKRNIKRMIDMDAPEADIDGYVASEGVTLQDLRGASSAPKEAAPDGPNMGFGVRASRETEPSRDQMLRAYEEQVRGQRSREATLPSYVDTAVKAAGRGLPFYSDFAAGLDSLASNLTSNPQSWQEARDRRQAVANVDREDRPVTAYGSELAGGLALPMGAVQKGATLGARVAQGAGVGAGYGAAYGASEGQTVGDRLSQMASGAAFGGIAGGAAVPILAGAGVLADKAGGSLKSLYGAITDPAKEAGRRVGAAVERDEAPFAAMLDSRNIATAEKNNQPLMNVDRFGDNVRDLARSTTNTSGTAANVLGGATKERFSTQSSRLVDWFNNAFGKGSNYETQQALEEAAKRANRPAYQAAYSHPNAAAIWDEDLAKLAQAPAVRDAIAAAEKTGANRAALHGFEPPVNPFVKIGDGSYALAKNADGSQAVPSLQFWDHVARNLGDMETSALRKGEGGAAGDYGGLKRLLQSKLDDIVPEFKDARAGAAKFFGAEDAREAGQKFVMSQMENAEGKAALAKMSDPERELFKSGYVNELRRIIEKSGENRDVLLSTIFNSKTAKERILMALGPKDTAKLEAALHIERLMQESNKALNGNSTTLRQKVAQEALMPAAGGLAGGLYEDNTPKGITLGALAGGATKRGSVYLQGRIADEVAQILASQDPAKITRLVQRAAVSPTWLNTLRQMTLGTSAAGASAGQVGSRLMHGRPAMADDERR